MVIQSLNGLYLHAAYGTSAEGADFSLTAFPDATYIGTYMDSSAVESNDPISYKWELIGELVETTDDTLEAENAAAIAMAQADKAESNTIINNNNIQSSQNDTDIGLGNLNELVGTNQGINNWTASAGLTLSSNTAPIYNPTDDAVEYLVITCTSAGSNYVTFNANELRAKLAETTDDNAFTFSADIRMSNVFTIPSVVVANTDGTAEQIDFGVIDPELIPVPEETADDLWVFVDSTANANDLVAESSQVLFIDLSNMTVGDTLEIANLKIEGGALATPWRASLEEVEATANAASVTANNAYTMASSTNNHFWYDASGAHITEVDQATYLLDPSNAGGNTKITTTGLDVLDGTTSLASFQSSGVVIGQNANGESRTEIASSGMHIIQNIGGVDTPIANIGYGTTFDAYGGTTTAPFYTFGERYSIDTPGVGTFDPNGSYPFGSMCKYNGRLYMAMYDISPGAWNSSQWVDISLPGVMSVAEGEYTAAARESTHAEGVKTISIGAICSHAEGAETIAWGTYGAHAEGFAAKALGDYGSHAEGYLAEASGDYGSHAEGTQTVASGTYGAHAEGYGTIASGSSSHAQNEGTVADQNCQTAIGTYNTKNNNNNLLAIGNGTADNARSDAFTVDSSGNVMLAGDLYFNATKVADYITERGTNGNWQYTKYASGRVECEGSYQFPSLTFSASGNLYRSALESFSIPSGIFSSAPTEGQAWIQSSVASVYFSAIIGGLSTTGGSCQIWKSTSGNATNVTIHMRLVYKG